MIRYHPYYRVDNAVTFLGAQAHSVERVRIVFADGVNQLAWAQVYFDSAGREYVPELMLVARPGASLERREDQAWVEERVTPGRLRTYFEVEAP